MKPNLNLPNVLTAFRIFLSAFLLMHTPYSIGFFAVYFAAGITDMTDGFLARKRHCETDFGAKFDSLADFCFFAACLPKILPTFDFTIGLWIWIAVIFLARLALLTALRICRAKVLLPHSFLNRLTGILLFLLPPIYAAFPAEYCALLPCLAASVSVGSEWVEFIKRRKTR